MPQTGSLLGQVGPWALAIAPPASAISLRAKLSNGDPTDQLRRWWNAIRAVTQMFWRTFMLVHDHCKPRLSVYIDTLIQSKRRRARCYQKKFRRNAEFDSTQPQSALVLWARRGAGLLDLGPNFSSLASLIPSAYPRVSRLLQYHSISRSRVVHNETSNQQARCCQCR